MSKPFGDAIAALKQTTSDFNNGRVTSVPHSVARKTALIAAVHALAGICGVKLQHIHDIDTRGELRVVALDGDKDPRQGCGHYGEQFVTLLNTARPRTGTFGTTTLDARSSWCYINHFDAEKMVLRYAESHPEALT